MPGAPDVAVAPRAGRGAAGQGLHRELARPEAEVGRVQALGRHGLAHHVGRQPGERAGQVDVVQLAVDDHVLVGRGGVGLGGGDEPGAHVAQVAAQRLRGPQRPAVGLAAGHRDHAAEHGADGPHERERAGVAGLAARARREQDQPVRPGLDGPLRVPDAGHVRPHLNPGVVQRRDHRGRRPDAGDDRGRRVRHDRGEIGLQPHVGLVHDEIRDVRSGPQAGRGRLGQRRLDLLQPSLQLALAARVRGGEAAQDAGPAGGDHEVGPETISIGAATTGTRSPARMASAGRRPCPCPVLLPSSRPAVRPRAFTAIETLPVPPGRRPGALAGPGGDHLARQPSGGGPRLPGVVLGGGLVAGEDVVELGQGLR